MSKKYVIEMKSKYEDTIRGIMVLGARDSNLYMDALAVEDMEELNSDYINEHFGDLQDTAYQRGLEDAWEAARKIVRMSEGDLLNIFTECYSAVCTALQVLLKYDASEAIEKLKAYEEKQKTADEIKVGDELEHTVSGYTSKAIFLEKIGNDEDEDWYKCLFWTGCGVAILSYPKRQFKRTGNHFDIDKILEAMKK